MLNRLSIFHPLSKVIWGGGGGGGGVMCLWVSRLVYSNTGLMTLDMICVYVQSALDR